MFGTTSGPHHSRGADGVSVSRTTMKKKGSHKHKHRHYVGLSRSIVPPVRNIVGCRIKHRWKEDCYSPISHWTGTVLDQIPVNPSLYLIKYDGFDCVYGLEILRDDRVQGLEILTDKIGMYLYF
ncbi:hypothetical protein PGIGA_G00245700 [Pangasianodon gigas]|uniref:Uncharacterized protein n=1 Tax=Pangasianodon gigas TaxID=30993 RepID=A0ACC5WPE0_PANGG|nr:hypothetical protein [Pangasianodon gigas]